MTPTIMLAKQQHFLLLLLRTMTRLPCVNAGKRKGVAIDICFCAVSSFCRRIFLPIHALVSHDEKSTTDRMRRAVPPSMTATGLQLLLPHPPLVRLLLHAAPLFFIERFARYKSESVHGKNRMLFFVFCQFFL